MEELNNICPSCNIAKLGSKLKKLEEDLKAGNVYSGDLLEENEINNLNNMCPVPNQIKLGDYIAEMLEASKDSTEVELLSDDEFALLDNSVCPGFSKLKLGTSLKAYSEEINSMVPVPEAKITAYAIGTAIGTITEETGAIAVTVASGTDVTTLIATFTASEGATVKVGDVSQVSGTTVNDFTNAVTYVVTNGTATKNYVVTVTVAE